MRVRWLRKALRHLNDEATYVTTEDAAAARFVVKRVLDAVSLLVEQPGLGRPGRVPGTRELTVTKTRYIGSARRPGPLHLEAIRLSQGKGWSAGASRRG